jgi:hypothetical protein
MPDRGEGPQSDGGRRIILPPDTPIVSLFENVTKAINSGDLELTNISPEGAKPPVSMVHGRARVWIAGGALAIALIGPCTPWVPDNVKTGFLTIAGTISASLFKGFESN